MTDVEAAWPPGRRDRKKQQTRAALTSAALRLVAEHGLDRVTVEDIAEAADVSSRTFFNYFTSKDEVLTGDQFVDSSAMIARFRAIAPEVPVITALLLALRPAFEAMQADQEIWFLRMRVVVENPSLLPRMVTRSITTEQELTAAVAERVGVGAEHGYPPLVTSVVGAACRTAMTRWGACGGSRPLAEFVDEAFGMLAAGLLEPPSYPAPSQPTGRRPLSLITTKDMQ